MSGKGDWTRAALTRQGFKGWVTFAQLEVQRAEVPQTGGVYLVVQARDSTPDFLQANPGGRFKGRDPTIDDAALAANWVDGAEAVYIGEADNLRRRLRQFAQFGAGKPIGHWGGRLIWQLAGSTELRVAWWETPGGGPEGSRNADAARVPEGLRKAAVCQRPASARTLRPVWFVSRRSWDIRSAAWH